MMMMMMMMTMMTTTTTTTITMLITFFHTEGTVHFEFIPQGQEVNQAHHVETRKQLCEAAHRKMPELRPSDWILHHDNAPAHKAFSVKQFLAQISITEMEHLPHSPDLAPNDFWLFPKIKCALKGRRFQVTEDIQKNVTLVLKAILQQEFQKCFLTVAALLG
jgi:histone-lysine N-methyltransferase SETMAR